MKKQKIEKCGNCGAPVVFESGPGTPPEYEICEVCEKRVCPSCADFTAPHNGNKCKLCTAKENQKHTPGIWGVEPLVWDCGASIAIIGGIEGTKEGRYIVATIAPENESDQDADGYLPDGSQLNAGTAKRGPCDEANARLMSAAPELLAALELIQEAFIHKPGDIKGNKARTAPLKYCNAEFSAALNAAHIAVEKAKGK